jgi:23S rRNA pseudouridine1911/1915/1917 synthase
MNTEKIKILHAPDKDDPFVILYKPHGMPSAPLSNSDNNNAFCSAAEIFPELFSVCGRKNIEYGLLHRLDNDACGLLVIASTQQAYDALYEAQKQGNFEKTYRVLCIQNKKNTTELGGFPPASSSSGIASGKQIIVESAFRPFGEGHRQVRPVTFESGKAAAKKSGSKIYRTEIEIVSVDNTIVIAMCRIKAGYRHQVRCHLAWQGLPVIGDALYNARYETGETLQFEGYGLRFPHPLTGEKIVYINNPADLKYDL